MIEAETAEQALVLVKSKLRHFPTGIKSVPDNYQYKQGDRAVLR